MEKKNTAIRVIDFYAIKSFHEMVTLSLLFIWGGIFDHVEYISGRSAHDNILKLNQQYSGKGYPEISFKCRWVCERDTSLGAFLRMCLGFLFVLKEFLFVRGKTLFYNYNNPFALPVILILNRLLRKHVVIIFHGELELLIKKLPLYKVSAWYKMIHLFSFRYLLKGSHVKILVLGDSIKRNMVKMFPQIGNNIISINHPYLFPDIEKQDVQKKKVIIGTVGTLPHEKGLDSLLRIGKVFEKDIVDGKLDIRVVGKVAPSVYNMSEYSFIKWGGMDILSHDEFVKGIRELDYILYLYPPDSYKLTASGALLDSIAYIKPVIALENEFFKEVFKECKIGYLCSSLEKVVDVINVLLNRQETHSTFIENLVEARRLFGVEYNRELLMRQL